MGSAHTSQVTVLAGKHTQRIYHATVVLMVFVVVVIVVVLPGPSSVV